MKTFIKRVIVFGLLLFPLAYAGYYVYLNPQTISIVSDANSSTELSIAQEVAKQEATIDALDGGRAAAASMALLNTGIK